MKERVLNDIDQIMFDSDDGGGEGDENENKYDWMVLVKNDWMR